MNQTNGNQTKSAIFPRGIFNSDGIYFFVKNIEVFQLLLKSKFLSYMAKVNPNNGNETKSGIFLRTYSNLTSFFIVHTILKYFNDFYNWYLSISLQK